MSKRRSKAWIYYGLIALVAFVVGFSHPAAFIGAILAGSYATYLYRGGRFVLWIW